MKKIIKHIPTQCCYYTEEDGETVIICSCVMKPVIDGKIFWEYTDNYTEKIPTPSNPYHN